MAKALAGSRPPYTQKKSSNWRKHRTAGPRACSRCWRPGIPPATGSTPPAARYRNPSAHKRPQPGTYSWHRCSTITSAGAGRPADATAATT